MIGDDKRDGDRMKERLRKIVNEIKKHLTLLKVIFICSVMFFVVNQMTSILHGMTWHNFKHLIFQQGLVSVSLMILIGFTAVLPMILYDVGTVKALDVNISKRKLLNDGWIINTINNLAGFGGVVGATLRINSYGKDHESKKVVATVTKTAFFMLSGLSILSFVMLLVLLWHPSSPYFHYWIWLLGGSLFAPGLLIFIKLNQQRLFKEFTNQIIGLFYLGSFGQWLGALIVFLFIGYQMDASLDLVTVAPLFVAVTLIGMLTMVPGGMGTFDVLMILGLNTIGVSREVAVVWILFYRCFYFILPFLSGLALFIHQTGYKVNRMLEGLPKAMISKMAHLFVTVILYGTGLLMILLSTIPNLSNLSRVIQWVLPFSFNFFDQTINMLIGLILIGLARGFYNKVKRAYGATIIVLALCIINTISIHVSGRLIIFYLFVLICVYLARSECYREKMTYSWNALLFDGGLLTLIFVFYGIVGYFINTKSQTLIQTKFLLFPSEEVWFAGLAGLIVASFFILALYHYLSADKVIGDVFDNERYTALLKHYSADSYYHHMAYSGGLRQYYYQSEGQDKVCLSFAIKANRCVVLGNPLGDEKDYLTAIETFMDLADQYNYQVVFYGISEETSLLLHHLGYDFMKIGEEGYYQPQELQTSTLKKLSLGEIYDYLPQLETISEAYESEVRSLQYATAHYTRSFVLSSQIVTYEKDDQIKGYCSLSLPDDKGQVALLYAHFLPEVTKEEVKNVMRELLYLADQEDWQLSFGMKPIVNTGISKYSFIEERLIRILYTYSEKTTDVERNYQWVQEELTQWREMYLSYPHRQNFFFILLQIASLLFKGAK